MSFLFEPKIEPRVQKYRQKPIIKRRRDSVPTFVEEDPFLEAALNCKSVFNQQPPQSKIQNVISSNKSEAYIHSYVDTQPAMPKRPAIIRRVAKPKPTCKAESALDIVKTRKYISSLEKQEKKYEDRNTIYDENGNVHEINPIYISPLSFQPLPPDPTPSAPDPELLGLFF